MGGTHKPSFSTIALTGASGFVGREVLRELLAQGYHVKALIRPQSISKTKNIEQSLGASLSAKAVEHLEWVRGGLGDEVAAQNLCRGADAIIHMAGAITARTRADYLKTNATSVAILAKAARLENVKRFVYLSSLTASVPDISDYGYSKHAGETALREAALTDASQSKPSSGRADMQAICVRAPAVFGAEDIATAPIYACIRKGFLPSPGGRGWKARKIGLVHVDDLAKFLTHSMLDPNFDDPITSVATKSCLTWPQFAKSCAIACNHPVRAIPLPLSVLYPVAAITSVLKASTGKGHLTLGKLQEFLYEDWSVAQQVQTGTDFEAAIRRTIYPHASHDNGKLV